LNVKNVGKKIIVKWFLKKESLINYLYKNIVVDVKNIVYIKKLNKLMGIGQ